ncbi:hypothetical protein COU57_02105 [Candidatus Pacearchaeota archaeon CG10_big_fil_rev_8_21_14_0_10_32_14]|nr:MAG: hypothetical protein COU57_02105 [Candidatus Pacearchaeota archaeon CG10_big_fil_rev_8_21_14_0_10_32_14]
MFSLSNLNPRGYFKRTKEEQVRRKNSSPDYNNPSISQEEYFSRLRRFIDRSKEAISFDGYDLVFMDDEMTINSLKKAIDNRGVSIFGVFPYNLETCFDVLSPKNGVIAKKEGAIISGFMMFDYFAISSWNSTKSTTYQPEVSKGVIFRQSLHLSEEMDTKSPLRLRYSDEIRDLLNYHGKFMNGAIGLSKQSDPSQNISVNPSLLKYFSSV